MARGLNKVMLIGNLGRDPETRYTPSNMAITKFSVATAESEKRNGQWEDHTEWHNVVTFGRTAEVAAQYLKKGSKVYIEGKLRLQKWEGQDGSKKQRMEIVCQDLQMLDNKRESGGNNGGGSWGQSGGNNTGGDGWGSSGKPPATTGGTAPADFDDDIPF